MSDVVCVICGGDVVVASGVCAACIDALVGIDEADIGDVILGVHGGRAMLQTPRPSTTASPDRRLALAEGLERAQSCVDEDPHDVRGWLSVGELSMLLGDVDTATTAWDRALAIYRAEGSWLKAVAVVKQALSMTPTNVDRWLQLADLFLGMGDLMHARSAALQAMSSTSTSTPSPRALAILLDGITVAEAARLQVMLFSDDHVGALYALGLQQRDRDEWAEALITFKAVLAFEQAPGGRRRHGDIGKTLHEIAWLTAQRGDLDTARSKYRRAAESKQRVPADFQQWDSLSTTWHELGVVEDQLGHREDALAAFRAALSANAHIADDGTRRVADAATWQAVAHVHLDHEDWGDAIDALTMQLAALDVDTDAVRVSRARYWQGYAHLRRGALAEAEVSVLAGLEVSTSIPEPSRDTEHHADLIDALAALRAPER